MRLDSVRDLKNSLIHRVLKGDLFRVSPPASLSVTAYNLATTGRNQASFALGITRTGPRGYKLAVRLQQRPLENPEFIEHIRKQARGEADIRYIGRVRPGLAAARSSTPWHQKRQRPLLIGASIGHFKITAGTLGCFVRGGDGKLAILSNNHVLANENDAKKGDAIIQPGDYDGGSPSKDTVAALARFVRLSATKDNVIDAATALVKPGIEADLSTLTGLGSLRGPTPADLDIGDPVHKVGRTTGLTHGKVTAIEVDNLVVEYDLGRVSFDNQIEIESTTRSPFSKGGDSGSLIVTDDLRPAALLFAGSDHGGPGDRGRTFANPIKRVLKDLKIKIVV